MSASSEVHEGIKIAAVALAVTISFGLLSFASGARAQGASAEQDTARTLNAIEVTGEKLSGRCWVIFRKIAVVPPRSSCPTQARSSPLPAACHKFPLMSL